jgi:murein DD-endopeptidase MepM/ murein hydrolase activator NlpD
MNSTQLFNKFVKILTSLTLTFLVFNFVISTLPAKTQTASEYLQREAELKKLQSDVELFLKKVSFEYEASENAEATLDKEISKRNLEIEQLDSAITKNNQLINIRNAQRDSKEAEVKDIQENIIKLLRDLQTQENSSVISKLLTAKNLTEAISTIGSLSSLGTQAEDLRKDFVKSVKELDTLILNLEKDKKQLESIKAEKASKKSGLEKLLRETQGRQSLYAAQIAEYKRQERLLSSQERLNDQAWAVSPDNPANQSSSSGGGGGGGSNPPIRTGMCYYEADPSEVDVPKGYFARPASGSFSRGLLCNSSSTHDGLDIANAEKTPIYAIADGTVESITRDSLGANILLLRHVLPNGRRIYSQYVHLYKRPSLSIGQKVSKGQQIALMGCTGNCSGSHLHLVIKSQRYENGGSSCRWRGSRCYPVYDPIKIGIPI